MPLTKQLTLFIQRALPNTDTDPVLFDLQEDEETWKIRQYQKTPSTPLWVLAREDEI